MIGMTDGRIKKLRRSYKRRMCDHDRGRRNNSALEGQHLH